MYYTVVPRPTTLLIFFVFDELSCKNDYFLLSVKILHPSVHELSHAIMFLYLEEGVT